MRTGGREVRMKGGRGRGMEEGRKKLGRRKEGRRKEGRRKEGRRKKG